MNHNKIPSNPSEAASNSTPESYRDEYESEADVITEPWAGVAQRLQAAKEAIAVDDEIELGLDSLNYYAKRRAQQVAEGTRGVELSDDEAALLDVFSAEAEMHEADATWDENLTDELVDAAVFAARDKAKAARVAGNHKEAFYWKQIEKRAEDYAELINSGVGGRERLDEDDEDDLRQKVMPNADSTGMTLESLKDGVASSRPEMSRCLADADNMRKTAELYRLFAEIQEAAVSTPPENIPRGIDPQDILKKQHEMVALQAADFASQVDADALEYNVGDVDKRIRTEMSRARRKGDETSLNKWQHLYRGLKEYEKAQLEDTHDELPDDIGALTRRRDVMEFFAELYPRPATPDEVKSRTEQAYQEAYAAAGGTTPEQQRSKEAETIREVLASAKNDTLIHTDAPDNVALNVGGTTRELTGRGFSSFGSNLRAEHTMRSASLVDLGGVPEAVQFQSATTQPKYEEGFTTNWRGKKEPYKRIVGYEEVPLPNVVNPETGKEEPGIVFRYSFSSQPHDYPRDARYDTNGGRPGNMLQVETTLSKSVASKLEVMIRENPSSVRELVRQLTLGEGGVPEDVWNGTRPRSASDRRPVAAIRPPYDQLPDGWKIGLYGNEVSRQGGTHEELDV